MSIHDIKARIKAFTPRKADNYNLTEEVYFGDVLNKNEPSMRDKIMLILIIILVGTASFGLGRLSKTPDKQPIDVSYENLDLMRNNLQTSANKASTEVDISKEGRVVASKNSTRYHYEYCPGAKQIKEENKIFFNTSKEAESLGFSLAGNCKPI